MHLIDDLRVIARIGRPFGVSGWLHLADFGGAAEQISVGSVLSLLRHGRLIDFFQGAVVCAGIRPHASRLVIQFEGVDVRETAALLTGTEVAIPRAAFIETSDDEYYLGDVIGMVVRSNASNELIGQVAEVLDLPAHAVLVVKNSATGAQHLLPFVAAIVQRVDLEAGCVWVEWSSDF